MKWFGASRWFIDMVKVKHENDNFLFNGLLLQRSCIILKNKTQRKIQARTHDLSWLFLAVVISVVLVLLTIFFCILKSQKRLLLYTMRYIIYQSIVTVKLLTWTCKLIEYITFLIHTYRYGLQLMQTTI
jgi:hypothetical protein